MGGARPPPLITFTLTSKVAVYAPAEWADTLTLFHLYQYMYSVVNILNGHKQKYCMVCVDVLGAGGQGEEAEMEFLDIILTKDSSI